LQHTLLPPPFVVSNSASTTNRWPFYGINHTAGTNWPGIPGDYRNA
jgi:hypothetical protein